MLHFGLGQDSIIDSLRITWPRGKSQLLRSIHADHLLTLREADAYQPPSPPTTITPIFKEIASPIVCPSTSHPKPAPATSSARILASADVNGDGLDDIFIGGTRGIPGALYLAQKNGTFIRQSLPDNDSGYTDAAALFFDANGDGKTDLYVASGGDARYPFGDAGRTLGEPGRQPNDSSLQDRLYLNDGHGHFTHDRSALPPMPSFKSCVRAADIDGDGHPDLFVGGRLVPGRYPEPPQSYLLINDGHGYFSDYTDQWNPALKHIGMVTDAAWTDIDVDGRPDLILVGEWMPVTVLINHAGKLLDSTKHYLGGYYSGWWNCLTITDLNNDGHPDIIAGNNGLNTRCKASDSEPAQLYYADFDNNGSLDPILCFYIQHHSYPFVSRDDLITLVGTMRSRFPDYKSFADATIDQVLTPDELKRAAVLQANHLATTLFLSDPTGRLRESALPGEVQYAPLYTITPFDYNGDGNKDLLFCGHNNHAPLRFGKEDANYGILLKGDGHGGFVYIDQPHSGLALRGGVRNVLQLLNTFVFSTDDGKIKAYHEKLETKK